MKSELSKRALGDIDRIAAWWLRELGTQPRAMLLELDATLTMLERVPEAGSPYASSRGRTVYRILLRDSQHHVYYRIEKDVIRVLTIRSTARERSPRFPSH